MPMLGGVPVEVELVRELIDRVDEPTAGQLEGALDAGRTVVALTIEDRERIMRALEKCPDALVDGEGGPLTAAFFAPAPLTAACLAMNAAPIAWSAASVASLTDPISARQPAAQTPRAPTT